MPKLTKRIVDATRPSEREVFVWDGELRGFGLRVLPSGHRSYVFQYRANGRTRRLALGPPGVLTLEDARRKAAKLRAAVLEGADPSATRQADLRAPDVAALCTRYLEDHSRKFKKPQSIAEDERLISRFILPALGAVRLRDVTRPDVLRLQGSLRETPIQANRVLALLSTMFNLAEKWGLRPDYSNPCRHVQRFREARRQRFLSDAELGRLAQVLAEVEGALAMGSAVVSALRLLLLTGARRGEILHLTWPEVDFASRHLRLLDSKTGPKSIPLSRAALDCPIPHRC